MIKTSSNDDKFKKFLCFYMFFLIFIEVDQKFKMGEEASDSGDSDDDAGKRVTAAAGAGF